MNKRFQTLIRTLLIMLIAFLIAALIGWAFALFG